MISLCLLHVCIYNSTWLASFPGPFSAFQCYTFEKLGGALQYLASSNDNNLIAHLPTDIFITFRTVAVRSAESDKPVCSKMYYEKKIILKLMFG